MHARLFSRQALCLLTFMALGAVSASAFSQSTEYRRGYDQGYRDGVAGTQQGGREQYGRRGRIVVEEAMYGTRESACDASDAIQRIAGGRRQFEIRVDNGLCGDPAKGQPKRLVVRYHCGDGPVQQAITPEARTMTLYCR